MVVLINDNNDNNRKNRSNGSKWCGKCFRRHCNVWIDNQAYCRRTGELVTDNPTSSPDKEWHNSEEIPFYGADVDDQNLYRGFIIDLKLLHPEMGRTQRMNVAKKRLLPIVTWQYFSRKDRKVRKFEFLIDLIISKYSFPTSLRDDVIDLYKENMNEKILIHRSRYIACITLCTIVCKRKGIPLDLEQLFVDLRISKKAVTRYTARFNQIQNPPPSAVKIDAETIKRYSDELEIGEKNYDKIIKLYDELRSKNYPFAGKNPRVMVAALIYTALAYTDKKLTQVTTSKMFGITETSLRTRHKEMIKVLQLPSPRQWKKEE